MLTMRLFVLWPDRSTSISSLIAAHAMLSLLQFALRNDLTLYAESRSAKIAVELSLGPLEVLPHRIEQLYIDIGPIAERYSASEYPWAYSACAIWGRSKSRRSQRGGREKRGCETEEPAKIRPWDKTDGVFGCAVSSCDITSCDTERSRFRAWFISSDYRVTLWQLAPPTCVALSSYATTACGNTGGHTWSEKCYLNLNHARFRASAPRNGRTTVIASTSLRRRRSFGVAPHQGACRSASKRSGFNFQLWPRPLVSSLSASA